MKLQHLRYIVETQRQGLNVTEAAESLFTSQPGISKQVKLLEEELGVAIFERSGKRFTGVTEPGKAVLAIAERILREAENLKRASSEFASGESGRLVLAATHTQARYAPGSYTPLTPPTSGLGEIPVVAVALKKKRQ